MNYHVLLATFTFSLLAAQTNAQETTLYNGEVETKSLLETLADSNYNKLMIIPFKPDMYRSDIDREIGKTQGYSFNEIRGYFRKGLDNALKIRYDNIGPYVSMHDDDSDINRDLDDFYAGTSMSYEILEVEDFEERPSNKIEGLIAKANSKLNPKEPKTEGSARMIDGQLQTSTEQYERYMKPGVPQDDLLDYLNKTYRTKYYLYITEFNILNYSNDYRDYESDNFTRMLRIHYGVFDYQGNQISSGAVKRFMASTDNTLQAVIKNNFMNVASEILLAVPGTRSSAVVLPE